MPAVRLCKKVILFAFGFLILTTTTYAVPVWKTNKVVTSFVAPYKGTYHELVYEHCALTIGAKKCGSYAPTKRKQYMNSCVDGQKICSDRYAILKAKGCIPLKTYVQPFADQPMHAHSHFYTMPIRRSEYKKHMQETGGWNLNDFVHATWYYSNYGICRDPETEKSWRAYATYAMKLPKLSLLQVLDLKKHNYIEGAETFRDNQKLLISYADAGIPNEKGVNCAENGVTYDNFIQWKGLLSECKAIASWTNNGFNEKDAQRWLNLGTNAEAAAHYRQNKITPSQAAALKKAGINLSDKQILKNLRYIASYVNSGMNPERITTCAGHQIMYKTYSEWSPFEKKCATIAKWIGIGMGYDRAKAWIALGITPKVAQVYVENGHSASDVRKFKTEGLNIEDPNTAMSSQPFVKKGYSASKASYYVSHRVTNPENVKKYNQVERYLRQKCKDSVKNEMALLMASPYALKGHCIYLTAIGINQWINKNHALGRMLGGSVIYLNFIALQNSNLMSHVLLFDDGAFQYTSAAGTLQTVPSMTVLESNVPSAWVHPTK